VILAPRDEVAVHAPDPRAAEPLLASGTPHLYAGVVEGTGVVEVCVEEGVFHVYVGAGEDAPVYGDGPAPAEPDARLVLDAAARTALARGETDLAAVLRQGGATVSGDGSLAKALRDAG